MAELSCAGCTELAGEVALGVAGAEERAEVLAHVEHCAACRAALASAADVADALVELMPPVAAPKSLEARTLAALSRAAPDGAPGLGTVVTAPPAWGRWRAGPRGRRPAVAVAAALAAFAIALGGWLVSRATAPGPTTGAAVSTASLVADHRAVGRVLVVAGDRPWISMAVSMGGVDETVECRVLGASGTVRTIGTFHIVHGYGYWAAPLPYRLTVRRAEIVMSGGRVVAAARLGG